MDDSKDEVLTLIASYKTEKNKNGYYTGEEVKAVEVFAKINSITRSEHYAAIKAGSKVDLQAEIDAQDYELPTLQSEEFGIIRAKRVKYEGVLYRIERSFRVGENLILTLKEN